MSDRDHAIKKAHRATITQSSQLIALYSITILIAVLFLDIFKPSYFTHLAEVSPTTVLNFTSSGGKIWVMVVSRQVMPPRRRSG